MQKSVETAGEFVVARGNSTELLEPIEEVLYQMARLVEMPVDGVLIDSIAARRDIGCGCGVGSFDGFDQTYRCRSLCRQKRQWLECQ
jgi:hypothetical protein